MSKSTNVRGGSYVSNGRKTHSRGTYTGSNVAAATPCGRYVTVHRDARSARFGSYVDADLTSSIERSGIVEPAHRLRNHV